MKYLGYLTSLILLFFVSYSTHAQQDTTISKTNALESGSIEEQFDYLIKKSNRYQDYRVVKQTWINKVEANILDSIQNIEKSLDQSNHIVSTQKAKIDSLHLNVANLNQNLVNINKEKESISFLGMLLSKSVYKSMMWALVVVLTILMSVFIFRFNRANAVTKESLINLEEVQQEFETFRKNAREKEQKLKRELQDEINKNL